MMKKIFYSIVLSVFLLGSASLYAESFSPSDVSSIFQSRKDIALETGVKLSSNVLAVKLDQPVYLIANSARINLGKISYTLSKARIKSLQVDFTNSREPKKPTRLFIYNNKKLVASLNVKQCSLKGSSFQCKFDKKTSQFKSYSGVAILKTKKN